MHLTTIRLASRALPGEQMLRFEVGDVPVEHWFKNGQKQLLSYINEQISEEIGHFCSLNTRKLFTSRIMECPKVCLIV